MRTDSNSVLSLSSNSSNKTAKSSLVPLETGASFQGDLDNAKMALDPLRPASPVVVESNGELSNTSQVDLQSDSSSESIKETIIQVDNDSVEMSESLADESGNALQFDGELPPENMLITQGIVDNQVGSKEQDTHPLILQSQAGSTQAIDLSVSNKADTKAFRGEDGLESLLLSEIELSDHDSTNESFIGGGSVDAALSSAQYDPLENSVAPSSVLGIKDSDAALKQSTQDGSQKLTLDTAVGFAPSVLGVEQEAASENAPIDSQLKANLSSENSVLGLTLGEQSFSDKAAVPLGVLNEELTLPLEREGLNDISILNAGEVRAVDSSSTIDNVSNETETSDELAWVLSQMNGSSSKAISTNLDVDVAPLETTKITDAVTAALLSSATDKGNRAGVLSTGLSFDGLAPEGVPGLGLEEPDTNTMGTDDILLIDEPIELRKKEQEQLINRISTQIDGRVVDEDASGGFNSSVQSNSSIARSVAGAGLAGPQLMNQPSNLTMGLPPGHPGWAAEMSQKVAWVARDGGHTAHIRLDPPELGSLTVKVSVDSDSNTQISFVAATPQARDLLEGQMARLRDMLAQQGMDLSRADVDVSHRDASASQGQLSQDQGTNRGTGLDVQDELDDELMSSNMSYVSATGVDYYA